MLAALPVFAQHSADEWHKLNQEAEELFRTGEYDHALGIAKKALEKTVALPNWVWPIVIGLVVGWLFQFWKKKRTLRTNTD